MATKWPEKRRLLGTKIPRLDGPEKSTGRAKYTFDINLPGMLHGAIVRCPHAHAKIKSIDTAAAEKAPGVKAVYLMPLPEKEIFHPGTPLVAVAAETEEQLHDALRLVKIDYEELPFQVKEEDVLQKDLATCSVGGPQNSRENLLPVNQPPQRGDVEKALREADAVVEANYGVPVIAHQCLEPHGLVAEWSDDDSLTVWASTQAVTGTAQQLAFMMRVPAAKVKCITHYIGGGFGSKFGPDIQGRVAAELARKAKAPV